MRQRIWRGYFKIARPDSSQILWTRQKKNQFDSFVYTNKQYSSFFQSYTHQTYKEIQNKQKTCHRTEFRISRFRTTDIHRRTDRFGQ